MLDTYDEEHAAECAEYDEGFRNYINTNNINRRLAYNAGGAVDSEQSDLPNERPLKLPFDDWKDGLAEFLEQETEDESKRKSDEEGASGSERT